ncbi:hypothetical protein HAX54_032395 [Datura stramonium]|uniref:Uncharacterized protein n=1 Tax=Datura stramonium TaxID=4076 RepID=A0ABS8SCS4_DATST|nr:hypothetical protein [Datura stramonium]
MAASQSIAEWPFYVLPDELGYQILYLSVQWSEQLGSSGFRLTVQLRRYYIKHNYALPCEVQAKVLDYGTPKFNIERSSKLRGLDGSCEIEMRRKSMVSGNAVGGWSFKIMMFYLVEPPLYKLILIGMKLVAILRIVSATSDNMDDTSSLCSFSAL